MIHTVPLRDHFEPDVIDTSSVSKPWPRNALATQWEGGVGWGRGEGGGYESD